MYHLVPKVWRSHCLKVYVGDIVWMFTFCLFPRFWEYFLHRLLLYKKNHSWKFYVFREEFLLGVFLEIVMIFSIKMFWCHCNWTRTRNHLVLKRTLNHLVKLVLDKIISNLKIDGLFFLLRILILFWIKMIPLMSLYIISWEAALIIQNQCSNFLFSLFIGFRRVPNHIPINKSYNLFAQKKVVSVTEFSLFDFTWEKCQKLPSKTWKTLEFGQNILVAFL